MTEIKTSSKLTQSLSKSKQTFSFVENKNERNEYSRASHGPLYDAASLFWVLGKNYTIITCNHHNINIIR